MDWDRVRYIDGSINLVQAYQQRFGVWPSDNQKKYLWKIEALCQIRSRQVASVALVHANALP